MAFDIALVGGIALTSDAQNNCIDDAFVGISGSRIAAIGPRAAFADATADRVIDCTGRLLTPGFVNVHTHAVLSLMRGIALDLGFAPAYMPGVPHGHDITPDEAVALARLGALEALTFGATTMVDSYVHADVTLPAMAEIGGRVWSCARFHDVDFTRVHDGIWVHDPAIGDACLAATRQLLARQHGGFGGRVQVMIAPHAPDTCSDDLLRRTAAFAAETGLTVWTHLSQSRAENEVIARRSGCTPTELLARVGLLTDRLIAGHCIHVTDTDIARIADAGVTVAHMPKGNATAGYMAPTPRLKTAGARIALATDNLTQDMIEAMRWALAVARCQLGRVDDEWQPHDALAMATRAGAAALGRDDLGRLAVGCRADVVVIDARRAHLTPLLDPLGTLVHDGSGRDVQHVFVDGRQVIADGMPLLVDEARIRSDAQHAAEALWRRAGWRQGRPAR